MFEIPLYGLYAFAFMIVVLPVIVLVVWSVIRGVQEWAKLWRGLGAGLLASASTVGVLVGWWYWIERLFPNDDPWIGLRWMGLLMIPIIGVAVGIWAVLRVTRVPQVHGLD